MYAELSGFREQLTPFTLFGGVLTVVFAALLISFGLLFYLWTVKKKWKHTAVSFGVFLVCGVLGLCMPVLLAHATPLVLGLYPFEDPWSFTEFVSYSYELPDLRIEGLTDDYQVPRPGCYTVTVPRGSETELYDLWVAEDKILLMDVGTTGQWV